MLTASAKYDRNSPVHMEAPSCDHSSHLHIYSRLTLYLISKESKLKREIPMQCVHCEYGCTINPPQKTTPLIFQYKLVFQAMLWRHGCSSKGHISVLFLSSFQQDGMFVSLFVAGYVTQTRPSWGPIASLHLVRMLVGLNHYQQLNRYNPLEILEPRCNKEEQDCSDRRCCVWTGLVTIGESVSSC